MLHSSVLGILVVGESLCLIHGKFDLSIESTLGLTAMVGAILVLDFGLNPYLTIIIVLTLGAFIGFLNSMMIIKLNIDPFIVTLGMLILLRGLSLVISKGITKFDYPEQFRFFAANTMGGLVSVPVILMFACFIFFYVILSRRVFGRQLYAVGGNAEAARLSGINVKRVKILVMGIVASFAALSH